MKKSTSQKASGQTKRTTKTAATKAVATTKRSAPSSQSETDPDRAAIIEQIVSIAAGLDDDGLALLLEQAKTVEYKGKIERFNREINLAADRVAKARREANRPDFMVDVEQNDDGFFIIQMDDARVFFNLSELREITRICHRSSSPRLAARKLFAWFSSERSDLLADAGINTDRSPYLTRLYEVVVSRYKVRGE